MGLTSSVSGNHSIRFKGKKWMWITPSGIPRYVLQEKDLVKVHLEANSTISHGTSTRSRYKSKPSIEWRMHASIYNKRSNVNAVVHTHSPYTVAIAISVNEFQHIIEESKIVVGNPVIISNKPSGSPDLANAVSNAFVGEKDEEQVRAVIIRNHGVVSIGNNIYEARAVIESLEEWAKIYTISKIFGGAKYVL